VGTTSTSRRTRMGRCRRAIRREGFSGTWAAATPTGLTTNGTPAMSMTHQSPPVGALVGLRGTVEVAFGYEWEDVPVDGERDWIVEAITVHQQPLERSPTSRSKPGTPVRVVKRRLSRMDRWADEPDGLTATYLIELVPGLG
jgi:hypothetical protein